MNAGVEAQITKLLSKYQNAAAAKRDVLLVVANYRSLSYKLQQYVFNDGSAKDLFCLDGTIPVVYKNNTYYIPICIWLMDTHPNNAPICFVKPTPTMQIKCSMYVDYNGKIYLPYLHDWQPHTSDLVSLIQVMIFTFGDHPPVYSKPKEQVAPYPASSGSGAGTGYLPYPTAGGSGGAFPPYPTRNNFGSYPPYPTPGNVNPGPNASGYSGYMNFPTVPGYNSGYNPTNPGSTGTITEEHIKASLISAVEDKLRRRLEEKVNQYQAEIDTLNRTKQELVEGSTKIDAIIARLQREEVEMQKNINILRDKEQELEKSLESMENSEGIDPDEAVTTTAPLYRQLLNSYAEEAATEDAIYYLGEALRSGVIDLETFLKHVRQLSRKQFMLRAVMQKCRQKAGLAG
ncbi:tumor susceptibility gene 101 protein-like isoform X2 [Teleopsis dalmanni]|uniref:tumor susceptibility gene 101 protein-like isoform X2 n=1 Tax=Teleopsis dalmanni TaxID=139649 RepID=UPI0018CDBA59|nr:tumor susceptibility gene 101 protein-like isoform X2 [Teleopsis dalmanni]XP_037939221.1 tumor susceptibility gene 101 protein-like isoform X2 [Teleopsis dalmanni]